VNHLLYGVGRAGGLNLDSSIIPVVKDRAGRVFNQQNTTTISLKREQIQSQVTQEVFEAVKDLFGLDPHSLQFAQVGYSPAFIESNENAVKTKNAAVAEENKVAVERAKAEQRLIVAQGEASAIIAAAKGETGAMIFRAEAEKRKRELEGEGQAALLKSEISALGGSQAYIKYLKAKARLAWDGQSPKFLGGSNQGTVVVPFMGDLVK